MPLSLWCLVPAALLAAGLWFLYRPSRGWSELWERPLGVVLLAGAALFLLGRWTA